MKSKYIENHLRRQAALLASMRSGESGFTLTELLVVVIISSIIVSALLTLVVQLTGTEQRESVRTETQREMQMALNYIASDLRQAVYIYEGEAHPLNPASDPSYINYIPTALQDQNSYRPVLGFWKTKAIPNLGVAPNNLPDFNPGPGGAGCLTFGVVNNVPSARANECNNLWLKRQNYSFVAYFQAVNNATTNAAGRWDGKSRIVRYELDKYSNVATLEREEGFVDPAEIGNAGFTTWPFGPSGANGGGDIGNCQDQACGSQDPADPPDPTDTGSTLVDFVDYIDNNTPAAEADLRDDEPDNCGALDIPGNTTNAATGDSMKNVGTPPAPFVDYYMLPSPSAAHPKPAFFICLKNTRDPAQPGNPRVGQIQDTVVFLRGNANGRGGTATDSFLPTLQTRITMRGVIDRVIR